MIRSIPNPQMSAEDIKIFRNHLKSHLLQSNESPSVGDRIIHGLHKDVIINLITKNSGGKNPLLR